MAAGKSEDISKKSLKRLISLRTKKSKRFVTRNALLLLNVAIVAIIGVFIFVDQRNTSSSDVVQNSTFSTKTNTTSVALDTLSSSDIAVQIARTARLAESTAVANQADSFSAQLTLAPTDEKIVTKPQLVSTNQKTRRDIVKYTVEAGDTVASLASKFGVTSDSIKWSNNLSSNSLNVGAQLNIPPRNGIVYQVKAGDTVDLLASKYRANKEQLIAFNDIELSGLKAGELILIPDGSVPAPIAYTFYASYGFGAGFNGYDYGYCTWYVANKRIAIGKPVPTNLGNARTWYERGKYVLPTGTEPKVGAAAVKYPYVGLGHVAYVEEVYGDGSFLLSEMNTAGWNKVSTKLVPASGKSGYFYIY